MPLDRGEGIRERRAVYHLQTSRSTEGTLKRGKAHRWEGKEKQLMRNAPPGPGRQQSSRQERASEPDWSRRPISTRL